jgi:DNA polymerase-3 subunit alpha
VADWSEKERLETERELVGYYLSGHPLERFEPDFEAFSTASAAEAARMEKGQAVRWVGLVKRLVPRVDRQGRMFAFAECEDRTGSIECTFFADTFMRCREVLREGEVIFVRGRIGCWRDKNNIVADEALDIDRLRADRIRAIELAIPWHSVTEANLARLREIAARHKGRRRLWFVMRDNGGEVRVEAGSGIQPASDLIRALQDDELVGRLRFVARR